MGLRSVHPIPKRIQQNLTHHRQRVILRLLIVVIISGRWLQLLLVFLFLLETFLFQICFYCALKEYYTLHVFHQRHHTSAISIFCHLLTFTVLITKRSCWRSLEGCLRRSMDDHLLIRVKWRRLDARRLSTCLLRGIVASIQDRKASCWWCII